MNVNTKTSAEKQDDAEPFLLPTNKIAPDAFKNVVADFTTWIRKG